MKEEGRHRWYFEFFGDETQLGDHAHLAADGFQGLIAGLRLLQPPVHPGSTHAKHRILPLDKQIPAHHRHASATQPEGRYW